MLDNRQSSDAGNRRATRETSLGSRLLLTPTLNTLVPDIRSIVSVSARYLFRIVEN